MMEDLLRILFLLCAIAAPGHSLSCLTCQVRNSECKGTSMTCPTGSACGLVYIETTEDGTTIKEYIKTCLPSNKCSRKGSISYDGGRMKMAISCCFTDDCTPPRPELPAHSTMVNGRSCPACMSKTNMVCDSDSKIECTGDEEKCISQMMTSSGPQSGIRGCASQSICDIDGFTYRDNKVFIIVSPTCHSVINNAETPNENNELLSCVACQSGNSLECVGKPVQCPLNHVCASFYSVMAYGEKFQKSVTRACAPKNKCDVTGTMSLPSLNVFMGTSCCEEDECTPLTELPSTIHFNHGNPNGVQCKTCISSTSDSCDAVNPETCRGDEDQCVSYTIKLSDERQQLFTFQGCGTKTLCDIQTVGNPDIENRFTCIKGKNDPNSGGNNITRPSNRVISVSLLLMLAIILNIHLVKGP